MAALTITATSIRLTGTDARTETIDALDTIVPGNAVDKNGNLVDITDSSKLDIRGIALSYAASGKKVVVATSGVLEFSDTVSPGVAMYCAASGQWKYSGDLVTDDYSVQIGVNLTANSIRLRPYNSGVQIP